MENLLTEQIEVTILMAGLIIGYIIKETPIDEHLNDWIPVIVAVVGAVLGVLISGLSVTAIVGGATSGLASTGVYEAFKNLLQEDKKDG